MEDSSSLDTIEILLRKAGYHVVNVWPGKAKISGKALSYEDVRLLKKRIEKNGFRLLSVRDTTWPDRPHVMN